MESVSVTKSHTVVGRIDGDVLIENYTRGKAIKTMCTECMGWGEVHPKECTSVKCPLYPYRGANQAAYQSELARSLREEFEGLLSKTSLDSFDTHRIKELCSLLMKDYDFVIKKWLKDNK